MKLLLIQPPIQDFYDTDIRLQPIGLCYLKAAIGKFLPHVDVTIRDFHQGWGRKTLPIPKELKYLQEYYPHPDKSPFCSFYHYYHFGATFEQIAVEITEFSPDFVGISSLFTPYYREVLQVAKIVKEKANCPVVVGGSHVSAVPQSILQDDHVDFVICGEGEKPIVELLREWQGGKNYDQVSNLGYKKNKQLFFNPQGENYLIDDLPHPDLSDLDQNRYLFEKRPLSFMITSRSCPHKCTFCSVHLTFGKRYRRRCPQDVIAEIKERYNEGYRIFDFEDDNLTFYVKEMKFLCRELIAAFPEKDVQFVAMNGISYLSLDGELLQLMKEAGFTHLNLALVSSDKTVRETTKRPHTVEKYRKVVEDAVHLGFSIVSYQILGLPSESLASMIQTLSFGARLPILLGASMFYLTPNAPIAKNFPPLSVKEMFTSRLTAMAIETEHFQREDIYTLFITTRIINFFKGLRVENCSVDEALAIAQENGGRDKIGSDILQKLFCEKKLYAYTKKGYKELPKFKSTLFFDVWQNLEYIATQNNTRINLAIPGVKFVC
ncbi:B12-binding domain-containing radical SAM protein [Candidatus Uabimicrobium amorphum]|uniref:B12-binding domain-containing radical SAM protein n=1 Tax=Uabimicrobium amorphum TaxID=2596890 RepID=A0A5S9IJY1_UABAM|nr:radical SAM protein [Candidatus Uabimicrobium amorphum]BBM82911.1 B12-binding domain-containing radical SAM protein [Candidatus Uabimicrobium amorphum]